MNVCLYTYIFMHVCLHKYILTCPPMYVNIIYIPIYTDTYTKHVFLHTHTVK